MFAWRLAGTLAAAAAIVGSSAASATAAGADVRPASPGTVAAALGADKVPADVVVLVDISDSMSGRNGGLYPQVRVQLPRFLTALAQQDPQDQVAVIVFGNRSDTHTIYSGRPTPSIPLPADATSIGTDIGYAFELALGNLAQASGAKLGEVLLLSDGGLWAPEDRTYDGGRGYRAPGWVTLRSRVQGLGIPVAGYGLPLTKDTADISALGQALTACFGSQQPMLSQDFSNLSGQLAGTQQKILDSRVAVAAQPDSGRGIGVSWAGPAVRGGTVRLDPPSGHADLSVRLAAETSRIPLRVSHLSVQVTGFPADVTATISSADIAVSPGKPVTLPVHLSWHPVTGDSAAAANGTRSWRGNLVLGGHVYSPFTNAIRKYYLDKSFAAGGLTGTASTAFVATIPSSFSLVDWFGIVLLVLIVIAGLAAVAFFRARLHGVLTVSAVGDISGQVGLPPRPWFSCDLDEVAGIRGTLSVRGDPLHRTMLVRLRHSRLPDGENTIAAGGRTIISGLIITHDGQAPDLSGPWASEAHSEPQPW